ncbi:MAG: DUF3014 domain-containing protein [Lysobacteraceae bacterium]|nr:MAG: DUF3014 domain-containing protein [Xanthomonadaceae bacterium]
MKKPIPYGPWLMIVALVAGAALLWHYYPRPAAAPAVAVAVTGATPAAGEPAVAPAPPSYPIEQVPALPDAPTEPLPLLDDSDGLALAALSEAVGSDVGVWLRAEFLLPRFVATVDALPRKSLTQQIYVARPVASPLAVAQADSRLWLDDANAARYEPAVRLFEALDSRRLVSVYVRFYPLLQQAYRDLGVPDRQFNDRLVEVIDHLLAAPELTGRIELVPIAGTPRLAFADPQRESASVGHKAMWRLGPDRAARVKAKLTGLRELLAGQRPGA